MRKNLFTPLLAFMMCLASCSFISKDFETDDKDDLVIQLITYVLDQAHYLDKEIDDNFSEEVFETFIENIDPYKRYFYASDYKDFSKYKLSIDDSFKNPDLTFFNLVHDRFINRISETKSIYKKILSTPFDFTKQEQFNLDIDEMEYVNNESELYDRWRRLLKIYVIENYHDEIKDDQRKFEKDSTFLIRSNAEIEETVRLDLSQTMDESYRVLQEELQRQDWFSIYINSFVSQYDPNTSYLDPDSRDRFDVDISGNYAGIGAMLRKKIDKVEITEIISGGPAWRDNTLEKGDAILKVRQEDEDEAVSILGMRLSEAVKLIKGKKGTNVYLTIKKVDGNVSEISIKRDIVLLEETYIKSSIVSKSDLKYGVINIPKFYIDFDNQSNRDAAKDLRLEINRLKEEGVKGLVIDLRNNGGGTKEMALRASDQFKKNDVEVNLMQEYFLNIGMAKTSTSAHEAIDLGYLEPNNDTIIMNKNQQYQSE